MAKADDSRALGILYPKAWRQIIANPRKLMGAAAFLSRLVNELPRKPGKSRIQALIVSGGLGKLICLTDWLAEARYRLNSLEA
jgi:hypothetical protein